MTNRLNLRLNSEKNIEERIREVVDVAGVRYDEYIEALSTSRAGYTVVQQRDLD